MKKREVMLWEEGDTFATPRNVVIGAVYHCVSTRAINLDRWTQENIAESYALMEDDITVLAIGQNQITVKTVNGATETWEFTAMPTFDGVPQWYKEGHGCMALVAAK